MRSKIINGLIMVGVFFLGGTLMYIGIEYTGNTDNKSTCYYTKCENKVTIDDTGISAAVDKVYEAVVMVENYQNNKLVSTGSGFVYKIDNKYGYVLTNQHVVDKSTSLKLIRSDDKIIEGTLLGGDVYLDLAVVRIAKDDVKKVAIMGDSSKSKLGDTVFTVGTPVGYEYRNTVTRGNLSGKDRMVPVSVSGGADDWVMKVIQIDAAINPGNSGGPLVNTNGEVIGVNSLKLVRQEIEGMGFAIPIEYAMSQIDKLETGKAIERPMIGINLLNINDTYNLYKNGIMVDESIKNGIAVVNVIENTPAMKAKLKKGDIITKINDEEVKNIAYLKYILYKYNIGDTINITYVRGKTEGKTKLTLTKAD